MSRKGSLQHKLDEARFGIDSEAMAFAALFIANAGAGLIEHRIAHVVPPEDLEYAAFIGNRDCDAIGERSFCQFDRFWRSHWQALNPRPFEEWAALRAQAQNPQIRSGSILPPIHGRPEKFDSCLRLRAQTDGLVSCRFRPPHEVVRRRNAKGRPAPRPDCRAHEAS